MESLHPHANSVPINPRCTRTSLHRAAQNAYAMGTWKSNLKTNIGEIDARQYDN